MILDVNKIQEGECLAWVSSPVHTLAVWTSFNKAVKKKKKEKKKKKKKNLVVGIALVDDWFRSRK
jgi:hypothetical protein